MKNHPLNNPLHALKTALFLCLISLVCISQTAYAEERVYLDITAPDTRKIKLAVPYFTENGQASSSQKAKKLADTLARAMQFQGIFAIIPPSSYQGQQNANWASLGADYVVLGNYSGSSSTTNFDLQLLNVSENKTLFSKSYSAKNSQQDKMLFRFCDLAMQNLTGVEGIASSKIAFVSYSKKSKDIYMTDILGKKVRQVTRHGGLSISPRFTPDGNYLSYSSYHSGNQNLYITDLRQNKITTAISRRKGMNLAPAWAPDGRSFVLTLSKYGAPDLFRVDRKGGIMEQLTAKAGVNVSPTFSPNGQHIVFVSDRTGQPQLYLMNLMTKQQTRLTYEGSQNAEPNWSPTENKIVYSSLRGGKFHICTLNPFDPQKTEQVTSSQANHESPVWSPDGNQIMYSKRVGGRRQIYAIMKNGAYERKVFSFPGNQSSPRWHR